MASGFGVNKHMSFELMIDILQTFANAFSWKKSLYFDKNSLWFVSKGPIDNKSVSVEVLAKS